MGLTARFLLSASLAYASTAIAQQPVSPVNTASTGEAVVKSDTTVMLGNVRRDLTADGNPEVLRLIGVGRTIDSLSVTFSIESSGRTIYQISLQPLTRTEGYDGNRRVRSPVEHRAHLADYSRWFFADSKFMRPPAFVQEWRRQAPGRLNEISAVVARYGGFSSDTLRGAAIWNEIQRSGVTLFEFSPGGDALFVIGWSAREGRFFRLVECC